MFISMNRDNYDDWREKNVLQRFCIQKTGVSIMNSGQSISHISFVLFKGNYKSLLDACREQDETHAR